MRNKFLKLGLTKNITYSSFFVALGILFPQLFHGAGAAALVISPMHIPVLMCAFFLDWPFALAAAVMTPVLSSLFFGMPAAHMTLIMVFEMAGYAVTANLIYTRAMPLFSKKIKPGIINIYISLTAALIAGRIAAACVAPFAYWVFTESGYTGFFIYMFKLFTGGIIAIVLQLLLIPPAVEMLKRYTIPVNLPPFSSRGSAQGPSEKPGGEKSE